MIRTALAAIVALVVTPAMVVLMLLARLFRVRDRSGGVYDHVPAWWSRAVLWAAGVRVRVHGREHIAGGSRIFACNHVSWFDVPATASVLPGAKYIAKAELFRVPVFSFGIRMLGMVPIERENRKAAFAAYDVATQRIRDGASVVVFPEGTRGLSYALRRFKKGPFVLAIAAGVPIVPMVIHGSMEVMGKGEWAIRPGNVDLHFLEPVPSKGYSYEQRDQLLSIVHERMAATLRDTYGVTLPHANHY